ncbi:beta-ketoacyl-ACP synthase II [bacterium]|nr:beta-ketoacyl-ACP synthase II [bacterium]
MSLKRVVVTGMGMISPIGNSLDTFWSAMVAGTSGAAPITLFDSTHFKTRFACEVKGFDPLEYVDKKEVRKMDRFTQFAIAASDEAMRDAGIEESKVDKDRVGVIWGAGIGGLDTFLTEARGYTEGGQIPRFNPFFIPKVISDIAPGMISIRHGLRGMNFATVSACASSTNALIDAMNYIRLGKAEVIVAGGSEATVTEAGVGGFNAMHALSTRNDDPLRASRPFDKERDGFVLAEGAACLIIEELEHAKARGAKIYAELVGGGMSADAHHLTAPHPEGLGAKLVMQRVLEDAQMRPEDIDYINVHGTSTPLGDIAEIKAILNVFGEEAYRVNISSTKSMTGHLLGAAGALEASAAVLSIVHGVVPPTINHSTPDPDIDPRLNLTLNVAQKREVRAAISNTFGFGGHNASVLFKKYEA